MTHYYRDIPKLIGELGGVLNEPNKAVLFHYICRLLPHEAQAEFDRIAAASFAGGTYVLNSSQHSQYRSGVLIHDYSC